MDENIASELDKEKTTSVISIISIIFFIKVLEN